MDPVAEQADAPAAATWVEFFDADGDPYYFNVATEETTRDKPSFPGLVLVTEEEYLRGPSGIAESDKRSVDSGAGGVDDWQSYSADDGSK